MPDGVSKTALAIQLFGRGGAALIPVLNEGRRGVQDLLDTAHRLGVVLDTGTARAAHEFHETLGELEGGVEGLQIKLMRGLLPALEALADRMKDTPAQFDALVHGVVTLAKDFLNLVDAITFTGRAMSAFWQLTSGLTPFSSEG